MMQRRKRTKDPVCLGSDEVAVTVSRNFAQPIDHHAAANLVVSKRFNLSYHSKATI